MGELGISYVNWNLSNKDESSAILASGCEKISGFTPEDLSQSGRWLYGLLTGEHLPAETEVETTVSSEELQTEHEGLAVDAALKNSWQTDGETYYQYALTLKDTSGSAREGWAVKLTFDGDITLRDGWNGEYTAEGSTLTIRSKDYNGALPTGGTVTDVGFIVSGAALAR